MRKISILLLVMLGLLANNVQAECYGSTETFSVGSNTNTFDLHAAFEQVIAEGDCLGCGGCGVGWDDLNSVSYSFKVYYTDGSSSDLLGVGMSGVVSSGYGNFDVKLLVKNCYNNPSVWGVINANNIGYIQVIATGLFTNFWTGANPVDHKVILKIYMPKVSMNEHLCSDKSYVYNDLVWNVPNSVSGGYINFVDGGGYSNIPQTLNDTYYYEFIANYNGYECFYPCKATINPLKEAYFVSTVQTNGLVTSLTPSSLMSSYVFTNGGTLNWFGSGLIMNGNIGWFDPSSANIGNNLMSVRTKNGECYSDWHDTIFYVTPIVNTINQPQISMSSAFGAGENGIWYAQNITAPVLAGKFHFACSDKNYVFGLSAAPQVGITYEWKAVFQNYVYHTSVGNTFSLTMPTRDQVQRNVQSSPFTIQQVLSAGGMYNAGVSYGTGYDVTGDGAYNSSDALNTFYMGDLIKIMVRGVNALGTTSDWSSVLIGLSQTPIIENNSVLCYEGNPILNSVSEYEVYLDSIDEYSVRSTIWDVNNDGVFEYDGSVDNILQFMTTNQKSDLMISQVIDSVKFYGYNVATNDWFDYYYPGASTVCYSNIDTVRLVRNPSFNTSFSEQGVVAISTPVLGVVSGIWLDTTDVVSWNWSDGSMTYSGDSCWHYLNDLGIYTLNVTIIDTFGCQVDSVYTNYWNVPGVLNIDEVESIDVSLYPVPCIDVLNIETDKKVDGVIIYDLNGKEMIKSEKLKIDIASLPSGIYLVEIKLEEGVLVKKINKL